MNRRDFLVATSAVAGGAAAASGTAAAQQGGDSGKTKTVKVGAKGNGGNFAFAPADIQISPGTTVVWKWTGKGGAHNVVAKDGSFDSGDPEDGSDVTFKHTFEKPGTYSYHCEPHQSLGMVGTVTVGNGGKSGSASNQTAGGNGSASGSSSGGGTKTVKVGAKGNGGNFAFAPADIQISPGTTVVWKWTGKGGAHNVVAKDGSFDSGDPEDGSDVTFKHTFEKPGTYSYHCEPHQSLGMVGTVTVGQGGSGAASAGGGGNTTGGGGNQSTNQTAGGQSAGGNQSAGGGSSGGGGTKTVTVGPGGSLSFDPDDLTIAPGTAVKFVWDSSGHNVDPANGDWGHKPIEDKGFSYTTPPFKQTGSQKYWCDPHKSAGMIGTITVKQGGASAASAGTTPVDPEEMGVPLQAHFVGIATILMMMVSLVYTFFLMKYGESPNAKGGD